MVKLVVPIGCGRVCYCGENSLRLPGFLIQGRRAYRDVLAADRLRAAPYRGRTQPRTHSRTQPQYPSKRLAQYQQKRLAQKQTNDKEPRT